MADAEGAHVLAQLRAAKAQLALIEQQVAALEAPVHRYAVALRSLQGGPAPAWDEALQDQYTPDVCGRRKRAAKVPERDRRIYVDGFPTGTVADQLRPLFPGAERVEVRRQFEDPYAFVLYPTPEEALAAASWGPLELDGTPLHVHVPGHADAPRPTLQGREQRTVVLRDLPATLTEADLRPYFPTAELEIRRSRRRCAAWVTLPTEEEAHAMFEIGTIDVGGCVVQVRLAGGRPKQSKPPLDTLVDTRIAL